MLIVERKYFITISYEKEGSSESFPLNSWYTIIQVTLLKCQNLVKVPF